MLRLLGLARVIRSMEFWQVFIVINALAALFVVWPTIYVSKKYRKELRSAARTETNSAVYEDHFEDLERTRSRGEINEAEMKALREDLEKTMIEENDMGLDAEDRPIIATFKSRLPVLCLVLALPIFSFILYSQFGAKKDWEIYELVQERQQSTSQEEFKERTTELILALQDRLKEKPKNVQNWYVLGMAAVENQMFDEGVRAFRQILEIQPDAPQVKAELAQALFLRAGNTITPEVRQHTKEALDSAPNMPTALGLAGIDAFRSGRYDEAVSFWQRALVQLDPNSSAARALKGGISQAQAALSKSGGSKKKVASASGPSLKVKVSLDGAKAKVNSDDAVFIYARAWQGPKMPLAIKKVKVSDLPLEVTLDSSMSMTQGMDLTSFPQVEVVARVSSSGSAITQAGDWQAAQGPIIVASQKDTVQLTIDSQVE